MSFPSGNIMYSSSFAIVFSALVPPRPRDDLSRFHCRSLNEVSQDAPELNYREHRPPIWSSKLFKLAVSSWGKPLS